MTGLQGIAFTNHGEKAMDMEPLWAGVLPWAVLLSLVAGISAIFG